MPIKHPNNPYDRADSYRVAVTSRAKLAAKQGVNTNKDGGKSVKDISETSIPTSNIFARFMYWILNFNKITDPEDLELLKKDYEIDDHLMNLEEFCMKVGTDPKKGITQAKALDLLGKEGVNNIISARDIHLLPGTFPTVLSFIKKILINLFNGYCILIWLIMALAFLIYGLDIYHFAHHTNNIYFYFGIFLFLYNIVNGILVTVQKFNPSNKLNKEFENLLPKKCLVIREGVKREIFIEELVIGDIVDLKAGFSVPADIRLTECPNVLKVDASNITGAHDIQIKHHNFYANDAIYSPNMLFASTIILEGRGRGVVIATGERTLLGRIVSLANRMIKIEVPFMEEVRDLLSYKTVILIVLIGILCLITTLVLKNYTWLDALITVLTVVIAALPFTFYSTLTFGMVWIDKNRFSKAGKRSVTQFFTFIKRFWIRNSKNSDDANQKCNRKRFVLRNLEAIETMGSLTTLLIDEHSLFLEPKNVKISHFWYDGRIQRSDPNSPFSCSRMIFGPQDEERIGVHTRNENWHILTRTIICCSPYLESKPYDRNNVPSLNESNSSYSIKENTIISYLESIQPNITKVRDIYRKVVDVPCKTKQLQMSIHLYENIIAPSTNTGYSNYNNSWKHYAFLRGHPLSILAKCSTVCIEGGRELILNDELKQLYVDAYIQLAGDAKLPNRNDIEEKTVIAYAEARLNPAKFPKNFDFLEYFGSLSAARLSNAQNSHMSSSLNTIINCNQHSTLNSCYTLSSNYNTSLNPYSGSSSDFGGALSGGGSVPYLVEDESYLFEEMDFRLVGMVALRTLAQQDKKSTRSLINRFKNAGIKVMILSKEGAETTKQMAKNYGIFDENSETLDDVAEKLNLTLDRLDPTQATCHIIDCEMLKDMSFAEIDNTLSTLLYNHFSNNSAVNTTLNTVTDSSWGKGMGSQISTTISLNPNHQQQMYNNNNNNNYADSQSMTSSRLGLVNTASMHSLTSGSHPHSHSQHTLTNFQVAFCCNKSLTSDPSKISALTFSHHKLRLIEAFQRLGDVIAVIGSTTPDCVALKRCDIGIGLEQGNQISHKSADLILMQDSLQDIWILVEEGRVFYDNLKKALIYILSSKLAQILPIIIYFTCNIPMPLSITTVFCVEICVNLIPSIGLFNEQAEGNVMKRRPRDIYSEKLACLRAFLFNGPIQLLACLTVYVVIMAENGFWPRTLLEKRVYWNSEFINDITDSYGQDWSYYDRKRLEFACYSGFLWTLFMLQAVNAIMCTKKVHSLFAKKSKFENWPLVWCLFLCMIIILFVIYVPGLNFLLKLQPIKFWWLFPGIPYALILFLFDESRKFIIRRDGESTMALETLY